MHYLSGEDNSLGVTNDDDTEDELPALLEESEDETESDSDQPGTGLPTFDELLKKTLQKLGEERGLERQEASPLNAWVKTSAGSSKTRTRQKCPELKAEEEAERIRLRNERAAERKRRRAWKFEATLSLYAATPRPDGRIQEGVNSYIDGNNSKAFLAFEYAIQHWEDQEPDMCKSLSRPMVCYLKAKSLSKMELEGARLQSLLDQLSDLQLAYPAPFVVWLYGHVLNRYRPRSEEGHKILNKAAQLCREAREDPTYERCFITKDCLLAETDLNILESLIQADLEEIRNRPPPDAICGHQGCHKRDIFWGSDGPKCVKVTCYDKHAAVYHKSCWRAIEKRLGLLSHGEMYCSEENCDQYIAHFDDLCTDGRPRKASDQSTDSACNESVEPPSDPGSEVLIDDRATEELNGIESEGDGSEGDMEGFADVADVAEEQRQEELDAETSFTAKPLQSAFTFNLDDAIVVVPRKLADDGGIPKAVRTRRRKKQANTMTLGELWKYVEAEKPQSVNKSRKLRKGRQTGTEDAITELRQDLRRLASRSVKQLGARAEKE